MSSHADSTLDWYLTWLAERNPEWTDEQRFEVATGFAKQQQPPVRPTLDDLTEENEKTNAEERKDERIQERKGRKYLTGEELMGILKTPGAIPEVN